MEERQYRRLHFSASTFLSKILERFLIHVIDFSLPTNGLLMQKYYPDYSNMEECTSVNVTLKKSHAMQTYWTYMLKKKKSDEVAVDLADSLFVLPNAFLEISLTRNS